MNREDVFRKRSTRFPNAVMAIVGMAFLLTVAIPAHGDITQSAVVATVSGDWTSSAVSVIPVDADEGTHTPENGLLAQANSDITLSSFGRYFFLFTRSGANTVAKVDISATGTPIWQFSTDEAGDENSNPYGMVFVNSEKAYLLRYGSATAWIVNPSAETEAEFKIGELDLSAYDDGDGAPEMAGGVIAGGKLFIMMQRLDSSAWYAPTEAKPYVAVFDTETDTEIDTAMGEGGLLGIPLEVWDPLAIQYLAENETIYVQGIGYYAGYGYPDYEYRGGIVAIDANAYDTRLIIDDGDSESHPYGNISGMAMVSPTKGYFVGYDGWGDNTLYAFDPSAETPAGTAVTGLQNKGIAGMDSGIYADKNGMLWVCNQTDARVELLNTDTDTVEESVGTDLNPSKVVFTVEGYIENDTDNNGIADAQEVTGAVDLDGDGVDDGISDTYKFLQTETGEAQVALAATENVNTILTMASIDPTDALADSTGTPPTDMPYGLIDFSLDVPTGATVQVTMYFSTEVAETSWYKYTSTSGWEDYTANAAFSALSDGRTQVVLTLQDGGIGDADGIANGIITDPSGPAALDDGSDSGSVDSDSDSGCFITIASSGAGMTAYPAAAMLFGLFLTTFAALRSSKK